VSKLPGYSAFN